MLGLPKHSEEGRRIRTLVRASEGFSILSVDYSQIELRVAAELCGDPGLVSAFVNGVDIHALAAHRVLGAPEKKEDQDESLHRLPAKAANFGYWMGLMSKGLTEAVHKAGRLDWSANCPGCKFFNAAHDPDCDSENFFEEYNRQFPEARRFQLERRDHAERTGTAYGLWGELWSLPGAWSPHEDIREGCLRQSHALPIQSGAQRLIKRAMSHINTVDLPWGRRQGMSVSPILQIHDELLFCVENGAVTDWYKRVKKTMESVVEWKVPVVAEGKCGPSWGEQKKIEGI